jgi:hypothetical protein
MPFTESGNTQTAEIALNCIIMNSEKVELKETPEGKKQGDIIRRSQSCPIADRTSTIGLNVHSVI